MKPCSKAAGLKSPLGGSNPSRKQKELVPLQRGSQLLLFQENAVDRIDLAVKKFTKKCYAKKFVQAHVDTSEDEELPRHSCNCAWFESCNECRKTAVN